MFADSLHAALTLDEVRALIEGLHFDPATVRQTLVLVFAQVVPAVPGGRERLLLRLPE